MLNIDLTGKRALGAGVADDSGFGSCYRQGAGRGWSRHLPATWPPVLGDLPLLASNEASSNESLRTGRRKQSSPSNAYWPWTPTSTATPMSVRCARATGAIATAAISASSGLTDRLRGTFRRVVPGHRRAQPGQRPRNEESRSSKTSRKGYPGCGGNEQLLLRLHGAKRLARWFGRAVLSWRCPTSPASALVPGYGGGMASAKAALESDARVLAFEAGRKWGLRVNVIPPAPGPRAQPAPSARSNR